MKQIDMANKKKRYGLKTCITSFTIGLAIIITLAGIGAIKSFGMFLMSILMLYASLASILSVIYLDDENIYIQSWFIPFSKKRIIPIGLLEKVYISSSRYYGHTYYAFHFKNKTKFSTFNSISRRERKALATELEKFNVEVINYDDY